MIKKTRKKRSCHRCSAYKNVCGIPICLLGFKIEICNNSKIKQYANKKSILCFPVENCLKPKNKAEFRLYVNRIYPQKTIQGEEIGNAI